MNNNLKLSLVLMLSLVISPNLFAKGNVLSDEEIKRIEDGAEVIETEPAAYSLVDQTHVGFKKQVYCGLNSPAEVQGYRVQCKSASYIDFSISDCCIPGDHWQLKGKNWDSAPNTAVTTSPGPVIRFGTPARVYNYGGTPQNPKNMDTYLQCSMLHGVDVFGAGAYINIVSDATNCTVTPSVKRSRIDRTP